MLAQEISCSVNDIGPATLYYPLSNDDFEFHDRCPICALAIPFSLSITGMVLPYDVLCRAMCESILKPTDIVACLTVCQLWYDAAIYQLLATITFDVRLGCTFWLAYFQRHWNCEHLFESYASTVVVILLGSRCRTSIGCSHCAQT